MSIAVSATWHRACWLLRDRARFVLSLLLPAVTLIAPLVATQPSVTLGALLPLLMAALLAASAAATLAWARTGLGSPEPVRVRSHRRRTPAASRVVVRGRAQSPRPPCVGL